MTTPRKKASTDLELKHEPKAKQSPTPGAGRYQPTTKEARVIGKMVAGLDVKAPLPRLKISDHGIFIDHPDEAVGLTLLMNAVGTTSPEFAKGTMCRLAQISLLDREKDEDKLNFALSVVADDQPTDHDETMIGMLKAASFDCAIDQAVRLRNAQTPMEADLAERGFNKCAKTFALLVDTLLRKRSGNDQNVVIQNNVAVNDNGQAIIGNVNGPKIKTSRSES